MLGKTQPCGVDFGHINGIQAASAAGRPDGKQKPDNGPIKAQRLVTTDTSMNYMMMAMVWGLFPR